MDGNTDVYCPTCFAMPHEPCITKYVLNADGVVPVMCMTHSTRVVDSQRNDFFRGLSPQAPQ